MSDFFIPTRIRDISLYIQNNYMDSLLLKDVADRTCLCPEAFCRYFKKHTGMTFITYLNQVRIAAACQLLVNNVDEERISAIAYECGFTSISSFNRMFKRIIGMTPSAYIKMMRAN